MAPKRLSEPIIMQILFCIYIQEGENIEDKKWTVYVHVNKTNGKRYVGITSQKVEYRWNHGRSYKQNPHFYAAIQKYGWDGFDHIILYEGLSKDEATSKEIELISKWKTKDREFGYNATDGGEGLLGYKPSAELRELWSKIRTGTKHSEETKQRMREAAAKLTTDVFEKRARGKWKPVNMLTMDGDFIRSFPSIQSAQEFLGISTNGGSHIGQCCRGERNYAYNYKWEFA